MIISLRGGHSANCKGAMGIKDEYVCMQELYKHTEAVLKKYGHTVINCNSNGSNANAELGEGARKSNNANADIFISLHMNALNGQAYGTEAWVHSKGCRAEATAKRLVDNFAILGFYNRGVKYNAKYYEMKYVNAPNIIFETCFCDSQKDANIFDSASYEKMVYLIANAIDSNIPKAPVEEIKYNAIAIAQTDIVQSDGSYISTIYAGQRCELRWITNDYRKYVRLANGKEGLAKNGDAIKMIEDAYIHEIKANGEKLCVIWTEKSGNCFVARDKNGEKLSWTCHVSADQLRKIEKEPIKEEKTVETTGAKYVVQTGVFSNKDNAEKLVEDLKAKGFEGIIKEE